MIMILLASQPMAYDHVEFDSAAPSSALVPSLNGIR